MYENGAYEITKVSFAKYICQELDGSSLALAVRLKVGLVLVMGIPEKLSKLNSI